MNKTIIAGCRDFNDYSFLCECIAKSGIEINTIISGCANGVDKLGEKYAIEHNIKLEYYPADWNTHGKAAGPIRNRQMAENADALIAIWDGKSRGTKNMIDSAKKQGLVVSIFNIN